jgi:hypothetical protein
VRVTPLIAAFIPGASPPDVSTPILLTLPINCINYQGTKVILLFFITKVSI